MDPKAAEHKTTEGKDEKVATIEQLKKHLPAVIEVGGATKLSATAKKKIEELAVGDEVEFVEAGVPEYGDMHYYTTVMLYLKIGGRKCAAYLQPGQFRGTNPTLEDLADNLEALVFTVEEMVPQAERSARAKSPKLVIRVAARDDA